MTSRVRIGGRAILGDGRPITWTVADGRRGRRWRVVVAGSPAADGEPFTALVEIDVQGRVARLELSSTAGLLTLHPEAGGLHGNVVGPAGVRHLSFPWSDIHELEIVGLPIASAITAHRLAHAVPVGEGREVRIVAVDHDLTVHQAHRRFERLAETAWRITDSEGGVTSLRIDERGIPDWGGEAVEWPLELESQP